MIDEKLESVEVDDSRVAEALEAAANWGPQPQGSLPGEIWKAVDRVERGGEYVDFSGKYAVSNYGRVKSYHKRGRKPTDWEGELGAPTPGYNGHILKTGPTRDGSLIVSMSVKGRRSTARVARLVLCSFVGEPDPGMGVLYDDGDRGNCRLSNLRWGSRVAGAGMAWAQNEWHGRQVQKMIREVEAAYENKLAKRRKAGGEDLRDRWYELTEKLEGARDKQARIGDILDKVEKFLWRT